MQVRVCRDCGEEFRPEVAACSDCGGVLEDRDDELGGGVTVPEGKPRFTGFVPEARPGGIPAGYLAVTSAPSAAEVAPLADRLAEAAIPFAVNASTQSFALLVPEADVEKALAALGMSPAEPGEAATSCPACGAAVRPGATECPDCGLGLGQQEP
jgi:hypothetical protein